MQPKQHDSEREEGEIVDDLDDLSEISSEEEYLLRQRLQVLENYNNVLERKEAKRSSHAPRSAKRNRLTTHGIHDLADISCSNFKDTLLGSDFVKKTIANDFHKPKIKVSTDEHIVAVKNRDKKILPKIRKRPAIKIISESSEESDYEYKNKRRKLADAVIVKKQVDTSLKARLMNMMTCGPKTRKKSKVKKQNFVYTNKIVPKVKQKTQYKIVTDVVKSKIISDDFYLNNSGITNVPAENEQVVLKQSSIPIVDLCEESSENKENSQEDVVDGLIHKETESNQVPEKDDKAKSDDDIELLRQDALKSKSNKSQEPSNTTASVETKLPLNSDDEDSDTAELRLICLRSALLKKAIEMKQKQKIRKRMSQSTSLYDDIIAADGLNDSQECSGNNTDIEAMDMDIGSDTGEQEQPTETENIEPKEPDVKAENEHNQNLNQNEELDEDEDVLRLKLLTSLSKKLPLMFGTKTNIDGKLEEDPTFSAPTKEVPPVKDFIINTVDSDSESEHEATKNLTKMHLKLSDPVDFQQRLDEFLKSTWMQVEQTKLPDVVQQPTEPLTPSKFVPKAVKHLPKSEQIEYKNLVKRMSELEKIKRSRQIAIANTESGKKNDTLKPRNVSMETAKNTNSFVEHQEQQIAMSRKKIAEESAKVLKLREEANKLSQKYKIVATELKNLSTAISLNKREQKNAQIRLGRIRNQHQLLVKRSSNVARYSKNTANKSVQSKSQENESIQADLHNVSVLQSVKVNVVNDIEVPKLQQLCVQIDVTSNKKTVTVSHDANNAHNLAAQIDEHSTKYDNQKATNNKSNECSRETSDYKSPLDMLCSTDWHEDPNGVLCPFEVGGSCKDAACKYLHPKPLQTHTSTQIHNAHSH